MINYCLHIKVWQKRYSTFNQLTIKNKNWSKVLFFFQNIWHRFMMQSFMKTNLGLISPTQSINALTHSIWHKKSHSVRQHNNSTLQVFRTRSCAQVLCSMLFATHEKVEITYWLKSCSLNLGEFDYYGSIKERTFEMLLCSRQTL